MNEVWDRVYKSNKIFFGEEHSNFVLLCLNGIKTNNVQKILELGAGRGGNCIFFASRGIDIECQITQVKTLRYLKKQRWIKRVVVWSIFK